MILKFEHLINSLRSFLQQTLHPLRSYMSDEVPSIATKLDPGVEADATALAISSNTQALRSGSISAATDERFIDPPVEPSIEQDELADAKESDRDSGTESDLPPRRTNRKIKVTKTCTMSRKGENKDGKCGKRLPADEVGRYVRCKGCRDQGLNTKNKSLTDIAAGRGVRKHIGKRKRDEERERQTVTVRTCF